MSRSVLVFAYAISNSGSEGGVALNWVREMLIRGWEVTVITRPAHGRSVINHLQAIGVSSSNLSKISICNVGNETLQKRMLRFGILQYGYQLVWQCQAFYAARAIIKRRHPDVAHVLTYAGVRIPSFAALLSIPVIWGPIGGGEGAPLGLTLQVAKGKWAKELLRWLSNRTLRYNPLLWPAMYHSAKVITLTNETRLLLPAKVAASASVMPNIGSDIDIQIELKAPSAGQARRFLFAGRSLYWKGGELAIRAFHEYLSSGGKGTLAIAGEGSDLREWKSVAQRLGVINNIEWLGWISKESLAREMRRADCFLYPSLHDSGGTVIVEALASKLPVLCLNLGGPGLIATQQGLAPVSCAGASRREVVTALARRMQEPAFGMDLSGAKQRLASWGELLEVAYSGV